MRGVPHARHARACRGHPRLYSVTATQVVDGRDKPGHDEFIRADERYAAFFAFSAMLTRLRAVLPDYGDSALNWAAGRIS